MDVPGYEVERPLARGGVGRVAIARRLATGERVALKVLPAPAAADPDAAGPADRFAREVEALRALEHPALARLVDAGVTSDGGRWLAMGLVEGTPLAQLLPLRVVGPGALGALLAKVARGLAAAHARGVVHRDVKPANIVVDGRLEPVLVDFGLAALDARRGELTGTGVAVGTPEYMAPEVLERGARAAAAACDVWALGVILHEGLAGRHPFAREALGATVDAVLRAAPPPLPPGTPAPLAAACAAALRRDPAARPAAAALAGLLDDAAAPSDPVTAGSETVDLPAPATARAPRAREAPARAGPYALVRRLGGGAHGSVHEARHEVSGAAHAVKLLDAPSDEATARFLREGRALARVPAHPGVVGVHDLGELEGGGLYLAMDLVAGPTLRDVLRRGPLAPGEVTRVGAALARALAHVHAQGLVHRDVKPANVVLRDGRAPVLVDFGLALDTAEDRLTGSGIAVGTPLYMAPEQLRWGARAGPPADVFALGALLFEALAGAHPFAGDGLGAVLMAVAKRAPPPLEGAPPALEQALRRALAKDPRERPDAATLARWLEGDPAPRDRRTGARGALALAAALALVVALALAARGPRHVAPADAAALTSEVEATLRALGDARRRARLGLPPPGADDPALALQMARQHVDALPACCDACPGGAALARARARLDAAARADGAAASPPTGDPSRVAPGADRDDAVVLAARAALATDPLRAWALLDQVERRDPGDPAVEAAARVRRDASAALAAGLVDALTRDAVAARLQHARPARPLAHALGRAVLARDTDEAARAAALEALAGVAGARALPGEAAALLARVGAARYAAGDLDGAAGPLSLARALDGSSALPGDANLSFVRRAREHLAAGRPAPAARLLAAIVRAGLRLDVNDRDLVGLEASGALAALARGAVDAPEVTLLRGAAAVAARVLGEAGGDRAGAAVERLEALTARDDLPAAARDEAAVRAIAGRCLLDPGDGVARADALLARPPAWLTTWRLCREVAARLSAPGQVALAATWARRAAAALPADASRGDRDDVEHLLLSLLIQAGALDEARARLDDAARGGLLGSGALLLRGELELRAGDLAAARAAIEALLDRRPDDATGLRLRERLLAKERGE